MLNSTPLSGGAIYFIVLNVTGFLCILSFSGMWYWRVEKALGSRVKPMLPGWAISPLQTGFLSSWWPVREGGCWLNRTIPFFMLLAWKKPGFSVLVLSRWSGSKALGPHCAANAKRRLWRSSIGDSSPGIPRTGLVGHKAFADLPCTSLLFSLALSQQLWLASGRTEEPAGA